MGMGNYYDAGQGFASVASAIINADSQHAVNRARMILGRYARRVRREQGRERARALMNWASWVGYPSRWLC